MNRSLNMFSSIALGVGAAYLYSLAATVVPGLFPAGLRHEGGLIVVYYEAVAVITVLVLLGQVLELRAQKKTGCILRALLKLAPAVARSSIRLAPLYDVVTTSIYGVAAAAITKYDRTLALNMAKTKTYPKRRTLLEFGTQHCQVKRPGEVIVRIADAMTATLAEHGQRVDGGLLKLMREAWGAGRGLVATGN